MSFPNVSLFAASERSPCPWFEPLDYEQILFLCVKWLNLTTTLSNEK